MKFKIGDRVRDISTKYSFSSPLNIGVVVRINEVTRIINITLPYLDNPHLDKADTDHAYDRITWSYYENDLELIETNKEMKQLKDVILKNVTENQVKIIAEIIKIKGGDPDCIDSRFKDHRSNGIIIAGCSEYICSFAGFKSYLEKLSVSFGEFVEILEAHNMPKAPIAFEKQLAGHDTSIQEDGIHVGCQTISYDDFDLLVKRVTEFRSK